MLCGWISASVPVGDPEAACSSSSSDLDVDRLDELDSIAPVQQCKVVKEETKHAPGEHLAWPDSFNEWYVDATTIGRLC